MYSIINKMKNVIKRFLFLLSIYNLKIQRFFKKGKQNTFLILPGDYNWYPDTNGSLGDDIMFLTICQELNRKYPGCKIGYICLSNHISSSMEEIDYFGFKVTEERFYVKFTELTKSYAFLQTCNKYDNFIVIGADVLDGGYGIDGSLALLKLTFLANKLGLETFILGFSFVNRNYNVINSWLRKVSKNTPLFVRDPISFERLQSFISDNLILSADISYNIKPNDYNTPKMTNDFVAHLLKIKENGDILLAINLVGWNINNIDSFLDNFVKEILQLEKTNLCIVLIPHDLREAYTGSDNKILAQLHSKLKKYTSLNVKSADFIKTGIEAKKIVGVCDVLISGRMHLAIAALSQNIPVLSFVYQGKFEGLYQMYNLSSDYLLDINEVGNLSKLLNEILEQRTILKSNIEIRNLDIMKKSKKNFEII